MNTPLKVLIVDDEALIAEHLTRIIKKHFSVEVVQAHTQKKAIDIIDSFTPNLVLLDIRLEKNTEGITIAHLLATQYYIPFLFITAFSDDVIMQQATAANPLAFITKPFKEADIKAAFYVAINHIKAGDKNCITVKEGTNNIKIQKQTIVYAETANDNYVQLTTTTKKYLLRLSLDNLLQALQDDKFIRIHRSYFINSHSVSEASSSHVVVNNTALPISRKYKDEVAAKLKLLL